MIRHRPEALADPAHDGAADRGPSRSPGQVGRPHRAPGRSRHHSLGSVGTRLPIFPLGTVLVPGLVLPLHIFEPRYRLLIEALMALPEGATRQFGVIALRSGSEAGEGQELD